jgi:hypothetical protein
MSDWYSFDRNFCESYQSSAPEIFNSISSLSMTFFGLLALFLSGNHPLTTLISASLAFCGLGSFGYHWTLVKGWGLLDRLPMTFLVSLTIFLLSWEICRKYKQLKLMKVLTILIVGANFIITAVDATHSHVYYDTFFSILCALVSLLHLVCRFYSHREYLKHTEGIYIWESEGIHSLSWLSLFTTVSAAIFWMTTELLCHYYNFLRYFHGHAFWHFFISYSAYLNLQLYTYIIADSYVYQSFLLTKLPVKYSNHYYSSSLNKLIISPFRKRWLPIVVYKRKLLPTLVS